MVIFANDYWNAMDKDKVEKIVISPRDIGLSAGIGDPWANLQAHIKAGAMHVELGFMGTGKGSVSSPTGFTPESISKGKREDIRQMAKLNNVTLSTHASANAMGFAGLGERGFSDQAAQRNVTEVKKAIDFAADTAEGGVVVIHTGEFQRGVTEAGLTEKEKKEGKVSPFESYPEEHKKGHISLVNTETGEILGGISKVMKIPEPDTDKEGNLKFDREGNVIFKETSLAKDYNFEQFTKDNRKAIEAAGVPAEEYFYQQIINKKRDQVKAEQGRWRDNMERAMRQKEEIEEKQRSLYEKEKKDKEFARVKAMDFIDSAGLTPKENTPEYKDYKENPIGYIDRMKDKVNHEIKYSRSGVEGHAKELKELETQKDKVKTMENFALEKTAKNIAQLGLYAYEVEKKRKLKDPLVIAPENIFAEQYGSHPRELKHIVTEARKEMEKQLVKNMSKDEAKKVAEVRIKATFDIGHANTWKKYFKGSDEDFKKWLLKEATQLQKDGIIGNVHLADNFGYEDEHLAPGMGNAPIEEFLKSIKKEGYKGKMVIEPGSQTEQEGGIYTAFAGGMAHLSNSPMYRTDAGVAQSWTDVLGGYLSNTWSPRHIQGSYAPSKEWTGYSETPIE